MSVTNGNGKRVTTATFLKKKQKGEKITILTAYDYFIAKLLDEAGVDSILVGDSAAMVMLGYDTTLPVTLGAMQPKTTQTGSYYLDEFASFRTLAP